MKYKAILLVIASSDSANDRYMLKRIKPEWRPVFPFFKSVYRSYMNEVEGIKVLFVYGNSAVEKTEDDLVYDIPENDYPGIVTKTLMAMEHVDTTYDYDFIIRTNLSTFWDLNRLSKRLDDLPKDNCIAGTPINYKDPDGNVYHYIAGHDMVLSRDLVRHLIVNKDQTIERRVCSDMEDLSLYTTVNQVNPTEFNDPRQGCVAGIKESNYDIVQTIYKQRNADHRRVKNIEDRSMDKRIMQRLLLETYGKTVL